MDEIEALEIFFGAVNGGRKFGHFRGARDLTLGVFGGVFRKHVSFFATNQSYQITNHYQPANRLLLYKTILLLLL
jgi:hypothetical protein